LLYTEQDAGTYRSLTVAKGFSQVPGKDFQEHHSPVVHDTTVCVVLVQKLVYNMHSHQFDTFTAFLYGLSDAPKTRPETGDDVLSPKDQTKYRSGVGMVLYLVKHSRPDVLDGATNAHWKYLIHTIKFVLDTKLHALRLSPFTKKDGSLFLHGYSDSEFAGDRETRKSVFGFITFLCGAPISSKSKACHSVTLSSTEDEYCAGSETTKEMMFIKSILETCGEKEKWHLPMLLCMDNTGAIYYPITKLLDQELNTLTSAHIMSTI
jgi:Reverse transcriptase (RNA-dependent DNA polymerase)